MKRANRSFRTWIFLLLVFALVFVFVGVGCDDDDDDYSSNFAQQEAKKTSSFSLMADDDYYIWRINHWYGISTQPLTQEDCNSWLDLWQTGKAFLAVRMPDEAALLVDAYNPAETHVISYVHNFDYIATLQLQPSSARQAYAQTHLPGKAGEHWAALAVPEGETDTCSGDDLGLHQWELEFYYRMDFGGAQGVGAGEKVTEYYCYEGQNPPSFFPETLRSERLLQRFKTQSEGITCVGPFSTQITSEYPSWDVHSRHFQHLTPSDKVQLRYTLSRHVGDSLTFQVDFSSDLNAGWNLYLGDENGPYQPLQPLESPFTLSEGDAYFWAVGDVPAAAKDGLYSAFLTLHLTQPTNVEPPFWQSSTMLWVGDWTPPSPPEQRIYVPLLWMK
jgi:hypothetical protein